MFWKKKQKRCCDKPKECLTFLILNEKTDHMIEVFIEEFNRLREKEGLPPYGLVQIKRKKK